MPTVIRYLLGGLMVVALAACNETGTRSSTSTGPTGPGGLTCRVHATAVTASLVSGTFSSTTVLNCGYNTSTNQLICNSTYSDSTGCQNTGVAQTSYTSLADFIDEVGVIPPLTRWTTARQTATGVCASGTLQTGTQTNSYDNQRRLTHTDSVSPQGQAGAISYTAWDSAGRPTAGDSTSAGQTTTFTRRYDDAARTMTESNGLGAETVTTYDSNGILLRQVTASQLGTVTTTYTITSTERVCR